MDITTYDSAKVNFLKIIISDMRFNFNPKYPNYNIYGK